MKSFMKNRQSLLMLLPAIVIFGIFVFWPTLYTFYLSFFEWNMVSPNKEFVGLENYISVFTDSESYSVLGNTVVYILILMVLNFVVPYLLSFVLHFMIPKFKDFSNLHSFCHHLFQWL